MSTLKKSYRTHYALGGSLRLEGPRHEEGGIPLGGAEVEGGEVIQKIGNVRYVLSDRLKVPGSRDTFAQRYEQMKKQGASTRDKIQLMKVQDQINGAQMGNKYGFGGFLKAALPIAAPLALSFALPGIGTAIGGSGLLSKALQMAPALFNVGRGLLGKDHTEQVTPQLADRSALGELRSMQTTYNANPELQAIQEQTRALQADPSASAATKLLAQNNALRGTSQVLSNKQNVETSLVNERQTRLADLSGRFALSDQDAINRARFTNADLRMQGHAAKENILGAGISQLSQIAQTNQANKIGLAAATAGMDPADRDELFRRLGIGVPGAGGGQGGGLIERLMKLFKKRGIVGVPVNDGPLLG